jgi:hypothetical protein
MIQQHIKDSTSMRELCKKDIEDAKTATRDDVADEEMVVTIFGDYCQNMEMPFYGKDQPGETYYTILCLKQSTYLESLTVIKKKRY